jgi:hypothetical protein
MGGGGTFLHFETLFQMVLEVKKFVTGQDRSSKYNFFLIHLIFQSKLELKNSD